MSLEEGKLPIPRLLKRVAGLRTYARLAFSSPEPVGDTDLGIRVWGSGLPVRWLDGWGYNRKLTAALFQYTASPPSDALTYNFHLKRSPMKTKPESLKRI